MTWDLIIVLFLAGIGFLLSLILGKNRIFLMLLGVYISSALLSVIPVKKMFPDFFGKEENFVVMIVSFLVLIGIVYIIFSKSVLKSKRRTQSIFQTFFYGLFMVGIVLTMIFFFLPEDLISQFSDLTLKIFNTSLARILWFVMPLIFIWIFKRNEK